MAESLLSKIQGSSNVIEPEEEILPDHVLDVLKALSSDSEGGSNRPITMGGDTDIHNLSVRDSLSIGANAQEGLRSAFSGSNGIKISGRDPIKIGLKDNSIGDGQIVSSGIGKIADNAIGEAQINASDPDNGEFLGYSSGELVWMPQNGVDVNEISNEQLAKMPSRSVKVNTDSNSEKSPQDYQMPSNSILGRSGNSDLSGFEVQEGQILARLKGSELKPWYLNSNSLRDALGIPTTLRELGGWPISADSVRPGRFSSDVASFRYVFGPEVLFEDTLKLEGDASIKFDTEGPITEVLSEIAFDNNSNTLEINSNSSDEEQGIRLSTDIITLDAREGVIVDPGYNQKILLKGATVHDGWTAFKFLSPSETPDPSDCPENGACLYVTSDGIFKNLTLLWDDGSFDSLAIGDPV